MYTAILVLPLIGAIIAGLFNRFTGERLAMVIPTTILFIICALSWIAFFSIPQGGESITLLRFITSGDLQSDWAIRVDQLTGVMLVVVTSVSALVHLYSIGYMEEDDSKPRFFAYLSFFTFAMLALATADNLVQLFFGWEGVGVASYLLIGFWYKRASANAAAIKAFIVNRIGDFGFILGIAGLFYLTGSIQFDVIFGAAPDMAKTTTSFLGYQVPAIELVTFLLFIGAMGKSAQFFLHTWLPDAMEGPTPVSALIHAATMVTAGVFLVCRMSPLYEYAPDALAFVTVIGSVTAFFAASVGLVQNDIKRVIAYSTCSQLGYMFAAAGVGAYQAAMFHLFTHAWFKALLFLGSGSVIIGMHHEQDMRKMGGLRHKMPMTYLTMVIGTLSITGVGIPFLTILGTPIGFSGFVSKDTIIEASFAGGSQAAHVAFVLLVVAAAMTAFYSWRLIFMTFHGEPKDEHAHEHAHESGNVMLIPLYALAIGAALAGMNWYPDFVGHHEAGFWGAAIFNGPSNEVLHEAHHIPVWAKISPFLAMLFGFAMAWLMYIRRPDLPAKWAEAQPMLYRFLLNKWYFDEIYELVFVRSAKWIGYTLWQRGDLGTIDGFINGLTMGLIPRLTRFAGRVQSGYVYHYAFAILIGVSLLVTWFAVTGGAH